MAADTRSPAATSASRAASSFLTRSRRSSTSAIRSNDDHHAVEIRHDDVAGLDPLAADLDRVADAAGAGLERRGRGQAGAPDRQADGDDAGIVAQRAIADKTRRAAVSHGADDPVARRGAALVAGAGRDHDIAGLDELGRRQRRQHVAGAVADRQRRPGRATVDVAAFADGADGRGQGARAVHRVHDETGGDVLECGDLRRGRAARGALDGKKRRYFEHRRAFDLPAATLS